MSTYYTTRGSIKSDTQQMYIDVCALCRQPTLSSELSRHHAVYHAMKRGYLSEHSIGNSIIKMLKVSGLVWTVTMLDISAKYSNGDHFIMAPDGLDYASAPPSLLYTSSGA